MHSYCFKRLDVTYLTQVSTTILSEHSIWLTELPKRVIRMLLLWQKAPWLVHLYMHVLTCSTRTYSSIILLYHDNMLFLTSVDSFPFDLRYPYPAALRGDSWTLYSGITPGSAQRTIRRGWGLNLGRPGARKMPSPSLWPSGLSFKNKHSCPCFCSS